MPLHATRKRGSCDCGSWKSSEDRTWNRTGASRTTALHESQEGIAAPGDEAAIAGKGRGRGSPCIVHGRLKVERSLGDITVGPEQADAEPQVQCQALGDAPVVLEIRFEKFVAVVILHDGAGLRVRSDVSCKEISKRIPVRDGRGFVKSQDTTKTDRRRGTGFVLLCNNELTTKGEVVRADDLGDGVAVVIDRIGINPRHEPWVNGKASAISVAASKRDGRQLGEICATGAGVENTGHRESRGHLERAGVDENQTVGGVASHEFVEKRGGERGSQMHDKARSRSANLRLNGGKRVA